MVATIVKGAEASYAIHAEGLSDAGPLRNILVRLGIAAAAGAARDVFVWDLDGGGDAQTWSELYPLLVANRILHRHSLVILRARAADPLPQEFLIDSSQDIGSVIFQAPLAQQSGGYQVVMSDPGITTTFAPDGSGIRGAMYFGGVGKVAFNPPEPQNGVPSFLVDRSARLYNTQGAGNPLFDVPAGPAPGDGKLYIFYAFDAAPGFQGVDCVRIGDNSNTIIAAQTLGLDVGNPIFTTDCISGGRSTGIFFETPGTGSDPSATLTTFLGTILNVSASLWGGSGATSWRPVNPFNQPTLTPTENTVYVNTETRVVEAMIGGTWTTIANLGAAGGDFVFGASALNDLNATLKEMPPGFSLQTFADGTGTGVYMTGARTFTKLTAGLRLGNAGNLGTTLQLGFYVNGALRQSVSVLADQGTPQVQSATFAPESVVAGDLVSFKLLPSAPLALGVFTLSATLS